MAARKRASPKRSGATSTSPQEPSASAASTDSASPGGSEALSTRAAPWPAAASASPWSRISATSGEIDDREPVEREARAAGSRATCPSPWASRRARHARRTPPRRPPAARGETTRARTGAADVRPRPPRQPSGRGGRASVRGVPSRVGTRGLTLRPRRRRPARPGPAVRPRAGSRAGRRTRSRRRPARSASRRSSRSSRRRRRPGCAARLASLPATRPICAACPPITSGSRRPAVRLQGRRRVVGPVRRRDGRGDGAEHGDAERTADLPRGVDDARGDAGAGRVDRAHRDARRRRHRHRDAGADEDERREDHRPVRTRRSRAA